MTCFTLYGDFLHHITEMESKFQGNNNIQGFITSMLRKSNIYKFSFWGCMNWDFTFFRIFRIIVFMLYLYFLLKINLNNNFYQTYWISFIKNMLDVLLSHTGHYPYLPDKVVHETSKNSSRRDEYNKRSHILCIKLNKVIK